MRGPVPETGYITLIASAIGLVDTIVGAATGETEQEAKKAQADAQIAQAKLDRERLQAQKAASWFPGIPNWAVVAGGALGAYLLLDL